MIGNKALQTVNMIIHLYCLEDGFLDLEADDLKKKNLSACHTVIVAVQDYFREDSKKL
jgi:hypothetical protein